MSATVIVRADADSDDCLRAAARAYIAQHPGLVGYALEPRWADEDRETVALSVPVWATEPDDTDDCLQEDAADARADARRMNGDEVST